MKKQKKFSEEEIQLIKRYLTWCYKTTKEELDRIERLLTQLLVDQFILGDLEKDNQVRSLKKFDEFQKYIEDKKQKASSFKFTDGMNKKFSPEYLYLKKRLSTIEKAISHFLGKRDLSLIKGLYEQEMLTRIIQARDHA